MLAGELMDAAARRSRETFAWVLLGFVGASLFVELIGLFVGGGFVVNAAGGHLSFVTPLHAAALALAVWLVSSGGQATGRARLVVQIAVALVAALLFVGVVAWLGGLTLEIGQSTGLKTVNSLRFVVDAGLLGAAGWFALLVLPAVPAPVRAPQRPAWDVWGRQHGYATGPGSAYPQPAGQQHWDQQQWDQQHWGYQQWSHPQQDGQQWDGRQWEQPQWPEQRREQRWHQPDAEQTQEFDPQPAPRLRPDRPRPAGLSIFDDAERPDQRDPGPESGNSDEPPGRPFE